MKTHFARLSLALLLPLYSMSGYAATVIKTLPFTITQPGSYVLSKNLTAESGLGIIVDASNVLIDLKGFSLTCGSNDNPNTGIEVAASSSNVTIQNGTIVGFSPTVVLYGPEATVQNLKLENDQSGDGIDAIETTSCTIQDCLIVGDGYPLVAGIYLGGCSDVVVKNNHISAEYTGVGSAGNNWFISNYVGNSYYGFYLSSDDKYQGNVTILCDIPLTGGIAVGTGNN